MTELPCPNCGSELAFLEQYQRYYCHGCQRYAPEGYGAHGRQKCPSCGGVLSYVAQYDRFYCFRCNSYAAGVAVPDRTAPGAGPVPTATAPPAAEAKTPQPAPAALPEKKTEPVVAPTVPEPSPKPILETQGPPAAPLLPSKTPDESAATPTSPPTAEAAAAKTAEPETAAPSEAMITLASAKPAVVRLKVFSLRKPELADLCKAYRLDPSGTRDELQERLLSYLKDLETGPRRETNAPSAASIPTKEPHVEAASPPPVVITPVAAPVTAESLPVTPSPAPSRAQTVLVEEAPARAAIAAPVPVAATAPVVEAPSVEHPCPTCGRELEYISQYARWYCYNCQRYAPVSKPKNACPTCGATLRWIEPYQRWWCESCRRYAPADLPKPSRAAGARPVVQETAYAAQAQVASGVAAHHRHANPGAAIGLVTFGVILFLAEALLVEFPAAFNMNLGITVLPEYALILRFLAFLCVALGAIAGLLSVRERA